jgi:hypothetical protein
MVVSPMALKSKGEKEEEEMVASPPVPILEVLEVVSPKVVSPMTLHCAEMVAALVPTRETTARATTMEVTPNLKSEEMTMAWEGSDSDAAACPTSTNSLKLTRPTTNTG